MSKSHGISSACIYQSKLAITNSKLKVEKLITDLGTLKGSVSFYWKGDASELYEDKMELAIKKLSKIKTNMASHDDLLNKLAADVKNQEKIEEKEEKEAKEAAKEAKEAKEAAKKKQKAKPKYGK